MIKTIELLEEKNNFLEQFLGVNAEWIEKLSKADYSELELYREDRETILNIVKRIDERIEESTSHLVAEDVSEKVKEKINTLMGRKDSLVKAILAQDLEIMQIVDEAKIEIIKELGKVRQNRKAVGSYRTYRRDDSLDEEI